MKHISYKIPPHLNGCKIKNIIRQELGFSSAVLTHLKKYPEGIMLNGKSVFPTCSAKAGDVLELCLKDKASENIVPVKMDLDILYEDEDILVVNKPRNMPTHPSQNHHSDTLANGVMGYYSDREFTFRVITRLDRDTSGIVLIAKNKISSASLTRQLADGKLKKTYLALCHGSPKETKGVINAPIDRADGSTILRCVSPDGKDAVTEYEKIGEQGELSVLRLHLLTGRTHQIRVHLSHIGNPIFGDDMYGSPAQGESIRLHCQSITFNHPLNGEIIRINAPVPDDMKNL